jgi:hypothetical protein
VKLPEHGKMAYIREKSKIKNRVVMKKISVCLGILVFCSTYNLVAQKVAVLPDREPVQKENLTNKTDCYSFYYNQVWERCMQRHRQLPRPTSANLEEFNRLYNQLWLVDFPNEMKAAKSQIDECEIKQAALKKQQEQQKKAEQQQQEQAQQKKQQQIEQRQQQQQQKTEQRQQAEQRRQKQIEENRRRRTEYLRKKREEREQARQARAAQAGADMQQNNAAVTTSLMNSVQQNKQYGEQLANKNTLAAIDNRNNLSSGSSRMKDLAQQTPVEEEIIVIGTYQGEDVLKQGDTIFTVDNIYLLSQQPLIDNVSEIYAYIPVNSFLIEKDITGNILLIGYITTGTPTSSTSLYGGVAQFARTSTGHKFTEFICDKDTYNKFLQYCDWEICRMENTANVNRWNYTEYDNMIKEDIALNERILNAKLSEILVQLVGDFTSDKLVKSFAGFDLNTSLQDWTMKTMWDEIAQLQKITGVSGDCFSSMTGMISSLEKESNPLLETTLADFMKSKNKEQDLYTTETYRTFKRIWVSTLDAVGDCDKSGAIKKNILYHLLKNAPSAGEAIGLYAANVTIKFSIAPEFKQSLNNQIKKAQQKKQFLENYKAQYQNLIEKNEDNCFAYTKIINQLRSGCVNPFGAEHEQEELMRMQKYVFEDAKIEICNVLNTSELKNKPSNSIKTVSNVKIDYTPQKVLYLASAAYDDNLLPALRGGQKLTNNDIGCINDNGFYEDFKTGYAGCAILDENSKTITISHRGTEITDAKDLNADLQIALGIEIIDLPTSVPVILAKKTATLSQYKSAESFINCIKNHYGKNYTYLQTGHSLGGAIAQLGGYYYGDKAITFDAPGVRIKDFDSSKQLDITNYVNHGSIISGSSFTNNQIGKKIEIYPVVPHEEGIGNLKGHSRDKIYDAFNSLTGEPYTEEETLQNAWNKNITIKCYEGERYSVALKEKIPQFNDRPLRDVYNTFEDYKKAYYDNNVGYNINKKTSNTKEDSVPSVKKSFIPKRNH